MYACITKANYLVWNTELEQAKEYMADKSHIPRMALELATIRKLLFIITLCINNINSSIKYFVKY